MAQTRLSSLPEEDNNFIIIHQLDSDSATLPRWFVKNNPVIRPFQNALLTDPAGNTFSVSLKAVDEVMVMEGFQEVSQAHNINATVRVHYTYVAGSQFNIRIFYDEYTEVAYLVQEEEELDYEEELAWFSNVSKAKSFGRQSLHVPADVVLQRLRHEPRTLNIILPDGIIDSWVLQWAPGRTNAVDFGHGWYEYGRQERIRAGDQLRFYETPETDTYRLEVHRH